ncbi:MAG: peptidyl-prolyl cis-trans isomerase [Desulfuromonadales bacterium]|nr:peptidyl-prolyl cis-trans isomerase [Desulfuromonadales bacterium]
MRILTCLLIFLLPLSAMAAERVVLETNRGEVVVELDPDKAPESVKNFLAYVDAGHYDGTIFHRVIDGFMIQGGGYTADLQPKPTRAPIRNEAGNGLRNQRGTIAMARTSVVDSATSQFFINLADNTFLDHRGKEPASYGYAVFGRVVSGLEVVDALGKMRTVSKSAMFQNLPAESIVIIKVRRQPK